MNTPSRPPLLHSLLSSHSSLFGYSVSRFVSFRLVHNSFYFQYFHTCIDPHWSNTWIYKYISAPQQKQQQQQIHPSRPPVIATSSMPSVSSEPIPNIDQLYSPKFPLEVVREFVMEALKDAVEINQVHNRDPIGWTNENLFLWVQKPEHLQCIEVCKVSSF